MKTENNIRLDVEQLAKDILEELDTTDFQHNPAWDIARKQIEELANPVIFKILNQTLETQALALEGMGNQQAANHLRAQKIALQDNK